MSPGFQGIRRPVRPMDQDQPPLRLEKSRAGLQPRFEAAGRQGMGRRPALVRRDSRLPLFQEGRVGEHEIGTLRPQTRRQARGFVEHVGDRDSPLTPLSRQFRRQSSARVGIALDKDEAGVCCRSATIRPTAPVAAPTSITTSPGRTGAAGGEQHRIGAGAVTLGGLAQGERARRAAVSSVVSGMTQFALRALHRR